MDQFTRSIVGFGVHAGIVDGIALCRMFQRATARHNPPKRLSSDHDPLYRFHQWQANLRVLGVTEIKTVPYVPLSHPFVERLIGTLRREFLDRTLFWTTPDLETNSPSSNITLMATEPMPGWRENCQSRRLQDQDHL
jgi:transposase InsO family protein